jgi:hypothetical protein
MLFMVIERFAPGKAAEVYRRFRDRGRMAPDDVRYVASWVDLDFQRCFQLMDAPNTARLEEWTKHWEDLVEFEIVPVRTSEQAASLMLEWRVQMRAILSEHWDPIGDASGIAGVAGWDEYDGYHEELRRLIQAGASPEDIAAHLLRIETEAMGLDGLPVERRLDVARRLLALDLPPP